MTNAELSLLIEGRKAAGSGRGQQLREAAGLNQSDMARLLGVSPGSILRWETGQRTPSGPLAVAYAKALRRIEREVSVHA